MGYFLKSVGMKGHPLPVRWWEERPELRDRMYFHREPKAIRPGDMLIYYAVGGDGRLCGVAEVLGKATGGFQGPGSWTPAQHAKFKLQMPVRVIRKCPADAQAPRLADFQDERIGQGSYQSVDGGMAERMIAAISACAEI
jgi:hypothetical protein